MGSMFPSWTWKLVSRFNIWKDDERVIHMRFQLIEAPMNER
jgi:hypothetical protein